MTTDDLKAVFDGNSQTNDPNEFTLNYTRRVLLEGPSRDADEGIAPAVLRGKPATRFLLVGLLLHWKQIVYKFTLHEKRRNTASVKVDLRAVEFRTHGSLH